MSRELLANTAGSSLVAFGALMANTPDLKPTTKKTLQSFFQEIGDKKLVLQGPDNLKMDSRYQVAEVAPDYVAIKLLGEDMLVLPFGAITSIRIERTQVTIRYH
jgi:hypothetical protein